MAKIIGFHDPKGEYGFLSNWYPSVFEYGGVRYTSVERYMMHMRALIFGDAHAAAAILAAEDLHTVQYLGMHLASYDDRVWNGMRQVVLYRGLYAKFSQNAELGQKLLRTGDAVIAEFGESALWGIGLDSDDFDRYNMDEWCGMNLLGFILMLVREKLRAGDNFSSEKL